ncbi:hypothetical protein BaRGS_00031644 [Batillaria attramentaria]|uniref:G-protein coupled receptors family 2 profile 2 domain-containing protein n=1 Tax=Batillaria attramentaria TaxID=370345 RepID=A0ABD0JQ04_9CAEN
MNVSTPSCSSFPDNPGRCDTVIAVRKAAAAFSFIGCCFMIVVIWLFRRYVVFAQRMILYLSIGALCDSMAYLMSSNIEDGSLCDFQAWWLTYFDWTVLLWVSCITFNLYMNVIKATETARFEWLYHAVCWAVPLLLSVLPFIGNHYGPAGAWCWIVEDIGWRLGIWYASTWEGTYDPDTERNHRMLKEDIKPLRLYPFVYLAVSIFPLINRIQNAFDPEDQIFWLVVIASLSAPLHGALNALVFGMDKDTLKKLTPSQIKMAFLAHSHQQEVREYPLALGHTDDLEATEDNSKFRHVAYSRLH